MDLLDLGRHCLTCRHWPLSDKRQLQNLRKEDHQRRLLPDNHRRYRIFSQRMLQIFMERPFFENGLQNRHAHHSDRSHLCLLYHKIHHRNEINLLHRSFFNQLLYRRSFSHNPNCCSSHLRSKDRIQHLRVLLGDSGQCQLHTVFVCFKLVKNHWV